MDWSHEKNSDSFFRKDGLITAPDQRTTVGRNDDGSWYIKIEGRESACANMTPAQMLNMCLGTLATMERYGVTIPLDWKRWTPPK